MRQLLFCYVTVVLFVFGDDAGDKVGGETAVDLLANHGDGGQTAGTDATEGVQRELAVGGAFAHRDAQLAAEGVEHLLSTAHIASGTQADVDGMLSLGLHGEEAVEGDDTIDLGHGHVQLVGDDLLDFGGQIAKLALHLVQHVDDLAALVTKGLRNLFDDVDFIFGQFYVCHILFVLNV